MDSLNATRRAVGQLKGDFAHRPVQHPAAAGAAAGAHRSEPAAAERARTRSWRRAAPRSSRTRDRPRRRATPRSRSGAAVASADQMYEASLAQLAPRQHRHRTAGPPRAAPDLSRPAPGRPTRCTSSARASRPRIPTRPPRTTTQVVDSYATSARAASALYNLGLLAERRKDTGQGEGRLPARGAEVPPIGRSRARSRSTEGARAVSPGAPSHDRLPGGDALPRSPRGAPLAHSPVARGRSSWGSASGCGWFSGSSSSTSSSEPIAPYLTERRKAGRHQPHRAGDDRLQARLHRRADPRLTRHPLAALGLPGAGALRAGEARAGAGAVRRPGAVPHRRACSPTSSSCRRRSGCCSASRPKPFSRSSPTTPTSASCCRWCSRSVSRSSCPSSSSSSPGSA